MLKVAVIWNPSRPAWCGADRVMSSLPPLRTEKLLLLGDAPGLDIELRAFAEYVVFKPYHLLDSSVEFNPKMFFVANKQKILNSDHVIVVHPGDESLDWAIAYTESRKPMTVLRRCDGV